MSEILERVDSEVYGMLGEEPVAIVDIARRNGPIRWGTIRNALTRLLKAGRVKRRWDGNVRYGRYVHVLADSP